MVTTVATTHRAQVLYDGYCAFCSKSVELLKRFDWHKVLTYVDVRDAGQMKTVATAVEPDRLVEEMHVVTPGRQRLYHGFGAVRWLAWQLPLLWPVAPFLYIPGVPTLGQKLYLWVARHRFQLVPCHGGVCTLPAHRLANAKQ